MFSGTTTEEAHEPLFVTDLHSSATPGAMSVLRRNCPLSNTQQVGEKERL